MTLPQTAPPLPSFVPWSFVLSEDGIYETFEEEEKKKKDEAEALDHQSAGKRLKQSTNTSFGSQLQYEHFPHFPGRSRLVENATSGVAVK